MKFNSHVKTINGLIRAKNRSIESRVSVIVSQVRVSTVNQYVIQSARLLYTIKRQEKRQLKF